LTALARRHPIETPIGGDTICTIPRHPNPVGLCVEDPEARRLRTAPLANLFKVRLANTEARQESASYLIQRRYAWRGYSVGEHATRTPSRITIAAHDTNGIVGTVTVGLDTEDGLFIDGLYAEEANRLRGQGRRIAEVTKGTEFVVRTDAEEYHASVLVVATGGLSIPKMGATDLGYRLARQFAVKIQPTRPALVPLVFGRSDQKAYCDLAGVSAEVIANANGASFREKMLITHRGRAVTSMLKGIDPILSPDLLSILRSMGHGDELALVDAHFPAVSMARRLVRLDGADLPDALAACLQLIPLDTFVADPALRMEMVDDPKNIPEVQVLCQKVIDTAEGRHVGLVGIERHAFYDRAKAAYAIVATGETRPYGCVIIKKGVALPT